MVIASAVWESGMNNKTVPALSLYRWVRVEMMEQGTAVKHKHTHRSTSLGAEILPETVSLI